MSYSTKPVRNQPALPSDMNKTIGGLNGLLITGFSFVRAFSSEFFERTFSLHTNFFDEMDPLASRLSSETKYKLYQGSQTSIFASPEKRSTKNEKPSDKEMKKTLGGVNLALIEVFSNTKAFGTIFFKRLSTSYSGFSDSVNEKSRRFSHDTQMGIYNSAKRRDSFSFEKVENLNAVAKAKTNEKIVNKSKNKSSYKRTAIVVALLGVVVLLAYYVFPMFQLEMGNTELVKDRLFYMFNGTTAECFDLTRAYVKNKEGKMVPHMIVTNYGATMIYSKAKHLFLKCFNLTCSQCKDKCLGK